MTGTSAATPGGVPAGNPADLPPLHVTVVYALPRQQRLVVLTLPQGARVADALACCGLDQEFPDLRWPDVTTGIWGRVVPPEAPLREGDRVEIYRPLLVDPREARRARAGLKPSSPGPRNRRAANPRPS